MIASILLTLNFVQNNRIGLNLRKTKILASQLDWRQKRER